MLRAYTWMQVRFGALRRREDGGVAAEYGILLAVVAIVVAAAGIALGTAIVGKLNEAATAVGNAPGGP